MSPLKCRTKVRYRAKKVKKGKKYVRLAFCNNKVIEAKVFPYKKLKKVI